VPSTSRWLRRRLLTAILSYLCYLVSDSTAGCVHHGPVRNTKNTPSSIDSTCHVPKLVTIRAPNTNGIQPTAVENIAGNVITTHRRPRWNRAEGGQRADKADNASDGVSTVKDTGVLSDPSTARLRHLGKTATPPACASAPCAAAGQRPCRRRQHQAPWHVRSSRLWFRLGLQDLRAPDHEVRDLPATMEKLLEPTKGFQGGVGTKGFGAEANPYILFAACSQTRNGATTGRHGTGSSPLGILLVVRGAAMLEQQPTMAMISLASSRSEEASVGSPSGCSLSTRGSDADSAMWPDTG
jgi:hypothetical protein